METIRGDKEAVRYDIDAATAGREGTCVTGLFGNRASAERAYDSLTLRGYRSDEVNIVMSDETLRRHSDAGTTTGTERTARQDAVIRRGTRVTVANSMFEVAASSASVHWLGIIFAGPNAAAMSGADPDGALAALLAFGMPEERAIRCEKELRSGSILLGVQTRNANDAEYFVEEWIANEGQHVYRCAAIANA